MINMTNAVVYSAFASLLLCSMALVGDVNGFVLPQGSSSSLLLDRTIMIQSTTKATTTELAFGIFPSSSNDNKDDDASDDPKLEKKSVGLKGLVQLITAGAGAPFLGDFQGVDEETGKFMFSLEANNLVDEDGNSKQTKMPYFEDGWVDESEEGSSGFKFPWQK